MIPTCMQGSNMRYCFDYNTITANCYCRWSYGLNTMIRSYNTEHFTCATKALPKQHHPGRYRNQQVNPRILCLEQHVYAVRLIVVPGTAAISFACSLLPSLATNTTGVLLPITILWEISTSLRRVFQNRIHGNCVLIDHSHLHTIIILIIPNNRK